MTPSFQQAKDQFAVNRVGDYEVTRQTLYDFQAYATAGATSFSFFQVPQGQGGKTLADTNMEIAGSLPAPKYFLVESIEIMLFPGVSPVTAGSASALVATNFANDMYALLKAGWLNFFIGSKTYLNEAPIGRFPPKAGKLEAAFAAGSSVYASAAATPSVQMDYAAWTGRPYFINPQVMLAPTQNFNVTLNFPTAVATPSGQNARIGVILDGLLYRLSQ